jgi:hypothetical protein
MCINEMKRIGIHKVYYSTESGDIECTKVSDMVPEHISYGAILSMREMTKLNQYLIFGITIDITKIDLKNKKIIFDNG